MKCKLCGYEIDNDIICPGCDTKVEDLISMGYVTGKRKKTKKSEGDFVVDDSLYKEDAHQKFKDSIDSIENKSKDTIYSKKLTVEDLIEKENAKMEVQEINTVEVPQDTIPEFDSVEPVVIPDSEVPTLKNDEPIVEELAKEEGKKSRKFNVLLFVILFILLVVVLAGTYFGVIYVSPTNMFKRFVNGTNDKFVLEKGNRAMEFESIYSFFDNNISTKGSIKVDENSNGRLELTTYSSDEEVTTSEFIKVGNNMYVHDENLDSNYIQFDESTIKDVDYYKAIKLINTYANDKDIISKLYAELPKLLDNKKFIKEYEHGSKSNVIIKYDDSSKEMLNTIIKKVIEDEKTLSYLANLFSISSEEVIANLNNLLLNSTKLQIKIATDYFASKYYNATFSIIDDTDNITYSVGLTLTDNNIKDITIGLGNYSYIINESRMVITTSEDEYSKITSLTYTLDKTLEIDTNVDSYITSSEFDSSKLNNNTDIVDIYNMLAKKYFTVTDKVDDTELLD